MLLRHMPTDGLYDTLLEFVIYRVRVRYAYPPTQSQDGRGVAVEADVTCTMSLCTQVTGRAGRSRAATRSTANWRRGKKGKGGR